MSSIEELFTEIIALQRELLSTLKLEEKYFIEGKQKQAETFQEEMFSLKKQIRTLRNSLKIALSNEKSDDVGQTSLQEQHETLKKKINELTKSNKKISQSPSPLTPQPEEKQEPKKPKHLLLEDET